MWFHGAGFREQLVWHKPGLLVLLVLGDFSQGAPSRKTTAHRDMDMMFWTSYIVERSNEIWKGEREKYGTFIIAFFFFGGKGGMEGEDGGGTCVLNTKAGNLNFTHYYVPSITWKMKGWSLNFFQGLLGQSPYNRLTMVSLGLLKKHCFLWSWSLVTQYCCTEGAWRPFCLLNWPLAVVTLQILCLQM